MNVAKFLCVGQFVYFAIVMFNKQTKRTRLVYIGYRNAPIFCANVVSKNARDSRERPTLMGGRDLDLDNERNKIFIWHAYSFAIRHQTTISNLYANLIIPSLIKI